MSTLQIVKILPHTGQNKSIDVLVDDSDWRYASQEGHYGTLGYEGKSFLRAINSEGELLFSQPLDLETHLGIQRLLSLAFEPDPEDYEVLFTPERREELKRLLENLQWSDRPVYPAIDLNALYEVRRSMDTHWGTLWIIGRRFGAYEVEVLTTKSREFADTMCLRLNRLLSHYGEGRGQEAVNRLVDGLPFDGAAVAIALGYEEDPKILNSWRVRGSFGDKVAEAKTAAEGSRFIGPPEVEILDLVERPDSVQQWLANQPPRAGSSMTAALGASGFAY